MTALRTAAQQALEVLEAGPDVDPIFAGETEDALRAALAEPVQEPVNERQFIINFLESMHERCLGRHNYYLHAANLISNLPPAKST